MRRRFSARAWRVNASALSGCPISSSVCITASPAPPWSAPFRAPTAADTAECCCAYNLLKLTRHLFTWTGEARYADYSERALFNGQPDEFRTRQIKTIEINPAIDAALFKAPPAGGQ